MGQGDSRSPRPLLEEPLLLHKKVKKKHRNTNHGLGALAMCLMIVNLCWGAILVTLYTKLSQKHHSHKTDPAIFWILRQLGEGDQLEEHPPSDPWWASRPTTPLDLPFAPSGPISPALQWVLLKLGQEEHLRHHNVSDKWWSHRPQSNITLNATNVSVTPMESYYHRHSRRLNEAYSSDDNGEEVRLFVKGRVRVGEYVEYYSQSKADYIKLIMAPESLRYVLKVLGLVERPWWDDIYWLTRDNKTEINVTQTFHMLHMTADSIVADDVIIEGPLNTFGSVDFWPARDEQTYAEGRRLFMHPHDKACVRCSSHWSSYSQCSAHCVAHMSVLGGFLSLNNKTCSCDAV